MARLRIHRQERLHVRDSVPQRKQSVRAPGDDIIRVVAIFPRERMNEGLLPQHATRTVRLVRSVAHRQQPDKDTERELREDVVVRDRRVLARMPAGSRSPGPDGVGLRGLSRRRCQCVQRARRVEQSFGRVLTSVCTKLLRIPLPKLAIDRVAQQHLKQSEAGVKRARELHVPQVQPESPLNIATGRGRVCAEPRHMKRPGDQLRRFRLGHVSSLEYP